MDQDTRKLLELTVRFQHERSDDHVIQIVDILRRRGNILQVAKWLCKLDDTTRLPAHFLFDIHNRLPVASAIINGGSDFLYPFWKNFDSNESDLNYDPFTLSNGSVIPFRDDFCTFVFLNHVIENFEFDTSHRLFSEAHRIVNPNGAIIVASPDRHAVRALESLEENGFRIISSDNEKICTRLNYIPRISSAAKMDGLLLAMKGGKCI